MAAAFAYEQPTINSSWDAFLKHLPTILLIWVLTIAVNVLGIVAGMLLAAIGTAVIGSSGSDAAVAFVTFLNQLGQFPFALAASFVGVLFVAVPARYYETGAVISLSESFRILFQRPVRYLLAGLLFGVLLTIGLLLCIVPGIAVALVMPVYINNIFNGEEGVVDALGTSFQSVYRKPNSFSFILTQIVAWLLVAVVSICTCFIGGLVALPVATFYIQNAAYRLGILN